jgi:hypothetical protein
VVLLVEKALETIELRREVDRCALGLLELGVEPGDVVSFQLPNWIEWVVTHYAASRIGAISNPLIPIYRRREVGFMVGLAKSMTKTMYRHLTVATEALNFGIAGPIEPLDRNEPGYREVPAFAQIVRRKGTTEAEGAQETLRVARFGVLKVARFIHFIGASDPTRVWDDALAREAAATIADADAHLRAIQE